MITEPLKQKSKPYVLCMWFLTANQFIWFPSIRTPMQPIFCMLIEKKKQKKTQHNTDSTHSNHRIAYKKISQYRIVNTFKHDTCKKLPYNIHAI